MDLLPNAALESLRLDDENSVKKICIVGGGPGGLCALKMIMDTPQYKDGLWVPLHSKSARRVPAPPVDDPPITPLYDSLTTNLPHPLMCYESFLFPPSTALFPTAAVVEKYLSDYAAHYKLDQHLRLSTPVLNADWLPESSKWNVRVGGGEEGQYDLLIVANGHYRFPRWPTTPGLDAWRARGKATHSAWFRRPENFGDTVLVVGGGPSGTDIARDMRAAACVVVHSVTNGIREDTDGGAYRRRGRVAEFLDAGAGRVRYEDGSVDEGIAHCILATGYQHQQPYLSPHTPAPRRAAPDPPLPRVLYNSTYHLFPLARHLFPLAGVPPSRLAFLGLLKGVAPLPLMEAQMRAVLHAFAHPDTIDATREAVGVVARYEDLRAHLGPGADEQQIAVRWHVFVPQEQYDYRDELHVFAGVPERVPQWMRDLYHRRDAMRTEWRELEHTGEADEWVRGVGEGGVDEWVELMHKLLRRAEDKKRDSGDEQKTKL